ncbi:Fungal specific transcription factor domain-containing protein [Cladophialophora immunda]|nr:Fungal specific transcription factor domain-containing protein [Cladophialophora immunda]
MAQPSQFTFINGPTLSSVEHREDLHRLRSKLISRGIGKQQKDRARSERLDKEKASTPPLAPKESCTSQTAVISARPLRKKPLYPTPPDTTSEDQISGVQSFLSTSDPYSHLNPGQAIALETYYPAFVLADRRCQQLIEYCIHVLWPGFRSSGDYPQQFYLAWLPQAASKPHLFHSMLCCASVHFASKTGRTRHLDSEQLQHRIRAIQSIRQVVSASKRTSTLAMAKSTDMEPLLIAMLFLAMSNDDRRHSKLREDCSLFTPPLKHLQWLSHYARGPLHSVHWEAVQTLVNKQGGIGNVKTFGLPWLLS